MSGFEDFDAEDYEYYIEIRKKHKEINKLRKLSPDKVGHPPISFFIFLELGVGDPCRMIV